MKTILGKFYTTAQEAFKNAHKGFEVIKVEGGYLVVNQKYLK
jgi:hypothetical protein